MAVGAGFEPAMPFDITVFKTAAFDHSAIPPNLYLLFYQMDTDIVKKIAEKFNAKAQSR